MKNCAAGGVGKPLCLSLGSKPSDWRMQSRDAFPKLKQGLEGWIVGSNWTARNLSPKASLSQTKPQDNQRGRGKALQLRGLVALCLRQHRLEGAGHGGGCSWYSSQEKKTEGETNLLPDPFRSRSQEPNFLLVPSNFLPTS